MLAARAASACASVNTSKKWAQVPPPPEAITGTDIKWEDYQAAGLTYAEYLDRVQAGGRPWPTAMRHALGLWNGQRGARAWRQFWSDHRHREERPTELARRFHAQVRPAGIDSVMPDKSA